MSLAALLEEAAARGVRFQLDGDKLRVRAPKGALTAELSAALTERKSEIIASLAERSLTAEPIAAAEHGQAIPLSLEQQRLWFLDQLPAPGGLYHIPAAGWLDGPLDIASLRRALAAIVRRHEVLRTAIVVEDGQPLQQVVEAEIDLAVEDLTGCADPEDEARRRGVSLVQIQFDLSRAPLLRAALFKTREQRHALILSLHHIIADAWSMGALLGELAAIYEEETGGKAAALPPLSVQFADFALWQRQQAVTQREQLVAHWRQQLAGLPDLLELPWDHPRPAEQSQRGAIERFAIDPATGAALRELAARHGVTLFQLLLAAFATLLHRYSAQEAIAIGSPVANRPRREFEPLIGFFVNTLVIPADFSGAPSFAEVLERTKAATLDAFAHQELPFETLVAELAPSRSLSHNPIFQAMFALQNTRLGPLQMGGVRITRIPLDIGVAKFDLYLSMEEAGDGGLIGEWEYSTDLFEAATVRRMIGHFRNLLDSARADCDAPVGRLPLMSADDEQRIVADWNATTAEWPRAKSLVDLLAEQASRTPNAVAVIDERRRLTYAELDRRANQVAHHLARFEIGREALVGVCVERGADMIVAVLGVLKAGAAYVALDPAYPRDRLAFMLDDAAIGVVLTDRSAAGALANNGARLVHLDADRPILDREPATAPPRPPRPEDLAYAIYTSGSTGLPKGILIEHRNAVALIAWAREVFTADELAGVFAATSLCFDLSIFEIFLPLAVGGSVIVGRNALALPQHPARNEVTLINTVPSAIAELVRSGGVPRSVRTVNLAGEPLKRSLADRIYALGHVERVYDLYGPGETTTYSTWALREREGRETIGRPIGNTFLYILDPDGKPVPVGVIGEIYIGGAGVTRGYLNRDELTAQRYLPDPFASGRMYRTGDLGRFWPDGAVQYLGRVDNQVKIRGFRIELGEIETAIGRHAGVRECIVDARQNHAGDKRLVAYFAGDATPEGLRTYLRQRLPGFMVPSAIMRLDALPMTPNGKIDRKALPPPDLEKPGADERFVAPVTPSELALCRIWAEVTGARRVGVNDNFFEIGGDSILAIQVVSRARAAGLALTPQLIFQRQTVAELAPAIQTPQAPAPGAPMGIEETGEFPLTPLQAWCLAGDPPAPQHFNQWLLLDLPAGIDAATLEAAVLAVAQEHRALRTAFRRGADGWRQQYEPRDTAARFEVVNDATDIAAERNRIGAALDLERGPLLRAALFRRLGQPHRLLLTAHHLVVDGVSWRILCEDLAATYARLADGEPPALPPRSASFQEWVEAATAREPASPSTDAAAPLPRDRSGSGHGTFGEATRIEASLSAEATRRLVEALPQAYRARIDDALFAAFAGTLAEWCGAPGCAIDVEGHGRDSVPDLDVSRTVGWFTAIDRIVASIAGDAGPGDALKAAKEALRLASRGGALAAPSAEVSFNYLGQIDAAFPAASGWSLADAGLSADPRRQRPHLLAFAAAIRGGRLSWEFEFAEICHDRATVATLAASFERRLRDIAEHCASPEAGGYTPSDFPDAQLSQAELDALVANGPADQFHRNIEAIEPLAPAQEGILFHALLAPEPGIYLTQIAFHLDGALDIAAFQQAWDHVAARHAMLRTCFIRDQRQNPLQVTLRRVAVPFVELDWRDAPDPATRLTEFQAEDRRQGIDRSHAPLMRVALARSGDTSWQCVWTCDHAILDGWSLAIVLREVAEAYDEYRAGNAPTRLPPPLSPAQLRAAQPAVPEPAAAFWQDEIGQPGGPIELPFERNLIGTTTGRAQSRHRLSTESTQALTGFARRHRLTLHTLIQAAWAILLARHADRDEVLFGGAVSGRGTDLPGVETAVGLLIQTVPVRIAVPDDRALVDWLTALQERQVSRERHAEAPLAALQAMARAGHGAALFETLLVFENYPIDDSLRYGIADLTVRDVGVIEWPHYPLTLIAAGGDRLALTAIYDTTRLDEAAAERILTQLAQVLAVIAAAEPKQPVGNISLLSDTEKQLVVTKWNATARPYPAQTVIDLFEAQVARSPNAPAVVFDDDTLTYAELDAWANRLARSLQKSGVGPDVLVGVQIERSLELVVALYGILKAGGAYVPLDPSYPEARLAFMREDSGVSLVLDAAAVRVVRDTGDTGPPPRAIGPENLAYMIYTSGSTGRPKGALNTHAGLANRLLWMQETFGLGADDAVLQKTPCSFDVSVWEFFWPLITGARLVLAAPGRHFDRDYLVETIARHRVTTLHFVPSVLRVFLDAAGLERCASLRLVMASGEALEPDLARLFRDRLDAELHNLYGPTEAAIDVTWWPVPRTGEIDSVPIGRPVANTQLYILDRAGRPVPPGVAGELHIGGIQVGRGYWNRPELTAERFGPNPFAPGRLYRTGDRARFRDDGAIDYLGRIDDQLKLGGVRIEPGEIEAALREQDEVADARIVITGEGDAKRLVAYCTPGHAATPPASAALRDYLRARLPEAMVPGAFVIIAALPLLPNGKLDRAALPTAETAISASAETALNRREREIAEIWRDVLGVERVQPDDRFFDLGGHSLAMMRVHGRLQALYGPQIRLVDLFAHPTVRRLAAFLGGSEATVTERRRDAGATSGDIAVIGLACRVPGAENAETFWENLTAGRESVRRFTDEELLAAGEDPALLADPRYVRAYGALANADRFDAAFFDMPPREAEIVDPQQRILLELAWEALENAGYDASRIAQPVGVFAGAGMNTYAMRHLANRGDVTADYGQFALLVASDKDYLPTRISYKLNLRGPSVTVQTACSTSLVAISMACDALRRGDCGVALAGGVTVRFPQTAGYLHEEGMIFSPDGHCRAFDASAGGIVAGSGAGIVVLKPLADAVADGDHIHAVIKGIAINNDGAVKVGYTAPSVEGQRNVIGEALDRAGVDPDSIGYVEAHGTGTAIGDPIEIAALTQAWRPHTARTGYCAIGSVKTNIGHLDAAAGVVGFIKAVLATEHGQIPPSLHFEQPNPGLDLPASPFYVSTSLSKWTRQDAPRRAAVSSFGIGGTNAHAIIEQAPAAAATGASRPLHILALSARTPAALNVAAERLASRLEQLPDDALPDAAYTLLAGRKRFAHRRAIVCGDRGEAIAVLRGGEPASLSTDQAISDERQVVFLFPGYGAQYPGMGRGLYERETFFRETIDHCAAALRPHLPGRGDIRDIIFGTDAATLRRSEWAQPAIFTIEYAVARLLMEWGVRPAAMLGHSVGEYAAACVAGTFAIDEALPLIAARGRLIQSTTPGAMLAVAVSEDELRPRLGNGVDLVAVTTPSACVVSGTPEDIERFRIRCEAEDLYVRTVDGDCAAHSPMMEPIMQPLRDAVSRARPTAPTTPFVSNVSADWIGDTAADPDYWPRHLRSTVRLSDSLAKLAAEYPDACFVEVGPGRTIASPLARHPARHSTQPIVNTMRAADDAIDDDRFLLNGIARLWTAGMRFDEAAFYAGEKRRRVPLPTYPFERKRYIVEPTRHTPAAASRDAADWLMSPTWQRSVAPSPLPAGAPLHHWLIFGGADAVTDEIAAALREHGAEPVVVTAGNHFAERSDGFVIRRESTADYGALLDRLDHPPEAILHLWSLAAGENYRDAIDAAFYSPIYLVQALQEREASDCRFGIVTRAAHLVTGGEQMVPGAATALGPARVIPQEIDGIGCLQIDIDGVRAGVSDAILAEMAGAADETVVAYRNGFRWVRRFAPLPAEPAAKMPLRDGGTYLVTGGLGSLGLEFAEALAGAASDLNLLLLGRTIDSEQVEAARRRLSPYATTVHPIAADVANVDDLRRAVAGHRIDGAIHAAGIAGGGTIALRTRDAVEHEFAAKVHGTVALHEVLREHPATFLALCSSTSTVSGGIGSVAYTAANAFQDAFAEARAVAAPGNGPPVISIGWYRWQGLGMAVEVERLHRELTGEALNDGIPAARGREALKQALSRRGIARVAVSPVDLAGLEQTTRGYQQRPEPPQHATDPHAHQRPPMATPYEAPRSATEITIAAAWRDSLGIAEIGINDHFTALGGDSLLAVRTVAHLRRDLAVALPVRSVYDMPTIAELARHIDAIRWAADATPAAPVPMAELETGVL